MRTDGTAEVIAGHSTHPGRTNAHAARPFPRPGETATIYGVMVIDPQTRSRIRLEGGDITRLAVDAIVNAANASLLGGGGVDGAIHRAAGPELLAECRTIGGCPPGEARLTRGYLLPAGHVIHTVGPVWHGGARGEREVLASCYRSCLAVAQDRRFRAIAFPAIATGVYGFPRETAAQIAVAEVCAHFADREMPQHVVFMCFDEATLAAYRRALGLTAG
jgi:O-acetyl-ADP-ribose deacetylase (regulator of RNase III)